MHVGPDAIDVLLRTYRPVLEEHLERWNESWLPALEYARAIGRLSAHLAVDAGLVTIGGRQVREAVRRLRRTKEPMIPCIWRRRVR
jgi:hypothetical protein